MAFEHNLNSGSLFKNDRKESENHPELTGECNVDGVKYRMAAWRKKGKRSEFFSVAFTPKDEPKNGEITDDDIPF